MNYLRWFLGMGFVQNFIKKRIEKSIKGPNEKQRNKQNTYLWGEVKNAKGEIKQLKLVTSNGYTLTVTGGLKMVEHALTTEKSGYFTPSTLVNDQLLNGI
jgi:short subunit dehydrogenase-like uncharacterized protein